MSDLDQLVCDAEDRWLELFTTGPTKPPSRVLGLGDAAPDARLLDQVGNERSLSEFWSEGPALIVFWRHFGCGCGVDRAARIVAEAPQYAEAGLEVVIVGQGEPERANAYRELHGIPFPILADPSGQVYDAYGIGHWQPEQVFFDAPEEYWSHPQEVGLRLKAERRGRGRPMVDDPWRATAEFVVAPGGVVRLGYSYQYCEDFPDPRVLTTAARLV
ncbi:MAG: peroxiredoxin-like family protein [Rhodoglobus sp.]